MATIPASDNEFPEVKFAEGAAPGTPASGLVIAYAKSDGLLYSKDDAGAETALGAAAHIADTTDAHDASAISIVDAGALYTATDVEAALAEVMGAVSGGGIPATILDAKGDLIAASAADTATRLAVGANGSFLQALSTETAGLIWRAPPQMAISRRTAGSYSTSSTSFVDVDGTNLALTITTLARRVRIGVTCSVICPSTANAFIRLDVDLDGSRLGGTNGLISARNPNDTTQRYYNGSFVYLTDVLTAASHTFKLQFAVSADTDGGIAAVSTDNPLSFWVEETFFTT